MTEGESPPDTIDRPVMGPWSSLFGCMIASLGRPSTKTA
jgi:hypothetical protein